MKKIISAVAVVALSGAIAFGAIDEGAGKAWGHGGHHRGGAMNMRLAKKLNLTDAQKDQMKALHRGFRQDNQAFFQSVRQTRQEMRAAKEAGDTAKVESLKATFQSQRAQMKQLHQAQQEKFLSILTPDQRTQLDALKAEREARRQQHQQQK
jgi:Spy/CpxP family protein refolding chaperone